MFDRKVLAAMTEGVVRLWVAHTSTKTSFAIHVASDQTFTVVEPFGVTAAEHESRVSRILAALCSEGVVEAAPSRAYRRVRDFEASLDGYMPRIPAG